MGIAASVFTGRMFSLVQVPFLPRDALSQSTILPSHVVRLCFRLSVRPSVTLVDRDHIGWKFWKLIAPTISPTPSLFMAERPLTPRGTWGNLGGTRGGAVEKWRAGAQKRQYLLNA